MNPSLTIRAGDPRRHDRRGTGIIDTIHLVEVARAIEVLHRGGALPEPELAPIRAWFADYVRWMTTHPNGIEERDAKNNHGTCWVMQVAAFAVAHRAIDQRSRCAARGSRPCCCRARWPPTAAFRRSSSAPSRTATRCSTSTRWPTIAQILDDRSRRTLWTFELPDGRGMRRALAFMTPFIEDRQPVDASAPTSSTTTSGRCASRACCSSASALEHARLCRVVEHAEG